MTCARPFDARSTCARPSGARLIDARFRREVDVEDGSAVAENAMTMLLVIGVFLVVCQFAYAVHVRSTLTMSAVEGARAGARVDATEGQAVARTREFIGDSLSARYAKDVRAGRSSESGVPVMRVDVVAPLPVLGPFGVGLSLHTSGRAVLEERQP